MPRSTPGGLPARIAAHRGTSGSCWAGPIAPNRRQWVRWRERGKEPGHEWAIQDVQVVCARVSLLPLDGLLRIPLKATPENDWALAAVLAGGVRLMTGEKFCSGCRRYRPAEQIASTRVVIHRTGKATRYLCVTCAETIRARTEKKAVA